MTKTKTRLNKTNSGRTVQISLIGMVVLCMSLIVATAVSMRLLFLPVHPGGAGKAAAQPGDENAAAPAEMQPWGELLIRDMEIEQPEEYVAFEATNGRRAAWTLKGTPTQAKFTLLDCGLTPAQIERAFSLAQATTGPDKVVIKPDDDLVLSLTPEARGKFYSVLAQDEANHYMRHPYCVPTGTFDRLFKDSQLDAATIEMVRKLLYSRGGNQYFSDIETVLHHIPPGDGRLDLLKALTREPGVFVRLRIRSSTNVDQLVSYWSGVPGVRDKDIRPLFESMKRMPPDGGSMSLLYLLPPFARERLFTSPLPSKPGDIQEDCHWTAMNFFSEKPDDRFADTAFTSKYIADNYYQIAKPTKYGDLVFLLDQAGEAIHSAVFIADDLVFTKNGANYAQPWILMRLKNLLATYTLTEEPKAVYYRRKDT